ncbi:putative odorant-binding protein A5 [Eurosta solidaginis]|uniref:putative odorant-binding protein A5 n=1 Tax=Eurosta solidaginis TaxID=178769 RepID=UPI0035316E11
MWRQVQRILIFCLTVWKIAAADCDVAKLFRDMEVVPDVLDEPPKELLKIEYENGLIVANGEEFTPTQTKDIPKLEWAVEPSSYYTVIMINPDAPSRKNPFLAEFLHWLVVNIPDGDINKGDIIDPYSGPMPPKLGGLFRYVFLVYKQPGKQMYDEPVLVNTDVEGHDNFSTMNFTKKYNMELVAGNFFQARWDDFVPKIHKQFGLDKL